MEHFCTGHFIVMVSVASAEHIGNSWLMENSGSRVKGADWELRQSQASGTCVLHIVANLSPYFSYSFFYLCDCVFCADWLWQMLPLLPFQVWLLSRSLLFSGKGKAANATTGPQIVSLEGWCQPDLQGTALAEPCQPSSLKRLKDRCVAHRSQL